MMVSGWHPLVNAAECLTGILFPAAEKLCVAILLDEDVKVCPPPKSQYQVVGLFTSGIMDDVNDNTLSTHLLPVIAKASCGPVPLLIVIVLVVSPMQPLSAYTR